MSTVDSVVRDTILDFLRNAQLFTALDVSNKVKESLPYARHREVRDLVRASFTTDMEPAGYARTPISVNLDDGSSTEALLYHPLTDSWDLDAKYDAQKRAQTSVRPGQQSVAATVVSPPSVPPVVVTVPVAATAAPVTPAVSPAAPVSNAQILWDSMFKSQPSLFPRR